MPAQGAVYEIVAPCLSPRHFRELMKITGQVDRLALARFSVLIGLSAHKLFSMSALSPVWPQLTIVNYFLANTLENLLREITHFAA
jgi:hypothetical protein